MRVIIITDPHSIPGNPGIRMGQETDIPDDLAKTWIDNGFAIKLEDQPPQTGGLGNFGVLDHKVEVIRADGTRE